PLFGRAFNKDQLTFLEKLEYASFHHEKIICDGRVYTGFLDVETVARAFHLAVESDQVNRLFQISSKDIMSPYEFAETYFSLQKKTPTLVKENWKFPIMDGHL